MRVKSEAPPEPYGALFLRAFAEGRITPEAYFYARSNRGRETYSESRELPEIPKGGIWVTSLGPAL